MVQNSQSRERKWLLVGIVSFGPQQCDFEEWPFVSTRIDRFIGWILENMQ